MLALFGKKAARITCVDVAELDSIRGIFLAQAAKVIIIVATRRHCLSDSREGGSVRYERKRKKARVARLRVVATSTCDPKHTQFGVFPRGRVHGKDGS